MAWFAPVPWGLSTDFTSVEAVPCEAIMAVCMTGSRAWIVLILAAAGIRGRVPIKSRCISLGGVSVAVAVDRAQSLHGNGLFHCIWKIFQGRAGPSLVGIVGRVREIPRQGVGTRLSLSSNPRTYIVEGED